MVAGRSPAVRTQEGSTLLRILLPVLLIAVGIAMAIFAGVGASANAATVNGPYSMTTTSWHATRVAHL